MRAPLALASASVALAIALAFAACGGSISGPTVAADAAQDGTLADADADADAAISCSTCLGARLDWEWNGGLAAYYDKSAALPCNTYQRQRFSTPVDTTPKLSCTSTIRHCDGDVVDASDAISIEQIVSALADSDVQSAFASAPVLYGIDPRAYDGVVFRITFAGRIIEIGDACTGHAGCNDAPAGVTALAALLRDLDARKSTVDGCAAFH